MEIILENVEIYWEGFVFLLISYKEELRSMKVNSILIKDYE